ncbi:hypothetical protein [Paraglaciecola sp. MB-3u-78]|uniref:hypothetical protein n=1 Tax=Paraglaciecola sp. MB-3u-78 TaxID=2058332 RepID=UPI000C32643A|nr:hypothetical protein [Paraglaciecola sp. MB-3u-78]PKH00893.1 hypothetical protein CXF95_01380 [Paraglaciecola sp. MB-3u-78]
MEIFDTEGDGSQDEATLWSLSNEFLEAAIVLKDAPKTKVSFSVATYYLVGHSAELSLKSYLFKQGLAVNDLKMIGHNLSNLIDKAMNYGLSDFGEIRALSVIYKNKGLEYLRRIKQSLPPIEHLINEVKKLQSQVFNNIVSF